MPWLSNTMQGQRQAVCLAALLLCVCSRGRCMNQMTSDCGQIQRPCPGLPSSMCDCVYDDTVVLSQNIQLTQTSTCHGVYQRQLPYNIRTNNRRLGDVTITTPPGGHNFTITLKLNTTYSVSQYIISLEGHKDEFTTEGFDHYFTLHMPPSSASKQVLSQVTMDLVCTCLHRPVVVDITVTSVPDSTDLCDFNQYTHVVPLGGWNTPDIIRVNYSRYDVIGCFDLLHKEPVSVKDFNWSPANSTLPAQRNLQKNGRVVVPKPERDCQVYSLCIRYQRLSGSGESHYHSVYYMFPRVTFSPSTSKNATDSGNFYTSAPRTDVSSTLRPTVTMSTGRKSSQSRTTFLTSQLPGFTSSQSVHTESVSSSFSSFSSSSSGDVASSTQQMDKPSSMSEGETPTSLQYIITSSASKEVITSSKSISVTPLQNFETSTSLQYITSSSSNDVTTSSKPPSTTSLQKLTSFIPNEDTLSSSTRPITKPTSPKKYENPSNVSVSSQNVSVITRSQEDFTSQTYTTNTERDNPPQVTQDRSGDALSEQETDGSPSVGQWVGVGVGMGVSSMMVVVALVLLCYHKRQKYSLFLRKPAQGRDNNHEFVDMVRLDRGQSTRSSSLLTDDYADHHLQVWTTGLDTGPSLEEDRVFSPPSFVNSDTTSSVIQQHLKDINDKMDSVSDQVCTVTVARGVI